MTLSQDSAEVIGLRALTWIIAHDELRSLFLGSSGLSEAELLQNASDPHLLGAVLAFITMDDAWVIAFCDAEGLAYTEPMAARSALPGGEDVHWT